MAETRGGEIGTWCLALPLGLVIVACAAGVAESASVAILFYVFGCACLALGLWTGPEVLETLAERPGSRIRFLAGSGRAFVRPLLTVLLLALTGRLGLLLGAAVGQDRIWLVAGFLPLSLSSYLVFQGWPSMLATWRGVGALVLTVETATVKAGGTVTASVETSRPVRSLTAALVLYDGASKAGDSLAGRFEGEVSPFVGKDGVWKARITARVPDDAASSLEGKDSAPDDAWRYWELEVRADDGQGESTVRAEEFTVA